MGKEVGGDKQQVASDRLCLPSSWEKSSNVSPITRTREKLQTSIISHIKSYLSIYISHILHKHFKGVPAHSHHITYHCHHNFIHSSGG